MRANAATLLSFSACFTPVRGEREEEDSLRITCSSGKAFPFRKCDQANSRLDRQLQLLPRECQEMLEPESDEKGRGEGREVARGERVLQTFGS